MKMRRIERGRTTREEGPFDMPSDLVPSKAPSNLFQGQLGEGKMNHSQSISRLGVSAVFIGLSAAFLTTILGPARTTQAALVENGQGPQLLIGLDDDTQD